MRAKVACLPQGRDAVSAGDPARLLDLAHGHLNEERVRLVLVGGPPGTGKSTVASALADALGCAVLSSERIRKELAGVPTETDLRAGCGEGIYTRSGASGRTASCGAGWRSCLPWGSPCSLNGARCRMPTPPSLLPCGGIVIGDPGLFQGSAASDNGAGGVRPHAGDWSSRSGVSSAATSPSCSER